jgi:hypothetical protein
MPVLRRATTVSYKGYSWAWRTGNEWSRIWAPKYPLDALHLNYVFWKTSSHYEAECLQIYLQDNTRSVWWIMPRPYITSREALNGFVWNSTLESFTKNFRPLPSLVIIKDSNGNFTWRPACLSVWISSATSWMFSQAKKIRTMVAQKNKTHFMSTALFM